MRSLLSLALLSFAFSVRAEETKVEEFEAKLKEIADRTQRPKDFEPGAGLAREIRALIHNANLRDLEEWKKVETKEQWEKFRDARITALKNSLGDFPEPPKAVKTRVTKTIEGEGYKIENTLFESRPGFWVTANVYQPAKPGTDMPGILIIHSHHNPKEQGELQDIGVTWARSGCVVLIMDQLGHGERRQHPFIDAKSYPEAYKVSRQDYFFRYNLGMQLSLVGESLIGWMAWDLMRGVDLLLAKPGIDSRKIILLGSVAGGGDPAAVTAAIDPRIKCVVPFNFGGPQPETKPLGEDAERSFNYAGGGSWESTRNLRHSVRDDFLPWLIVASTAPRYLVNAHEFAWFGERDPVWKRYQRIWGFYGATDWLAVTHGSGSVSGKPPESTHCNNIGEVHRKNIHPAFEKWFGIKAVESKDRHPAEELRCWTDDARKELQPRTLFEMLASIADKQMDATKARPAKRPHGRGVQDEPKSELFGAFTPQGFDGWRFNIDRGEWRCTCLVIRPNPRKQGYQYPVAVIVSRQGEAECLRENARLIATLISRNIAACVVDLNLAGSTANSSNIGRGSYATSLSSSELMLGSTLLGRSVTSVQRTIGQLRKFEDVDRERIAIIGYSNRPVNAPDRELRVPYDVSKFPEIGDPFGGLVATGTALNEPKIRAVAIRGGLFNFRSAIDGTFVYVSHDSLVPGRFRGGDLERTYGALTPQALRFEGMIDAQNRLYDAKSLERALKPIKAIYDANGGPAIEAYVERQADTDLGAWIEKMLSK
jgi:dienelactone hydrolase